MKTPRTTDEGTGGEFWPEAATVASMPAIERMLSPIGELTIVTGACGLQEVRFGAAPDLSAGAPRSAAHHDVMARLRAYFDGDRTAIDGIAVAPEGTAFQRRVWLTLRQIPAGSTWTYRQLAEHVDRPTAIRAVGAANGANPIPIVLPCHRVIGSNGRLVGYGGGLEAKRWLLDHEARRT